MDSHSQYLAIYHKLQQNQQVDVEQVYQLMLHKCLLTTPQADYVLTQLFAHQARHTLVTNTQFIHLARIVAAFQEGQQIDSLDLDAVQGVATFTNQTHDINNNNQFQQDSEQSFLSQSSHHSVLSQPGSPSHEQNAFASFQGQFSHDPALANLEVEDEDEIDQTVFDTLNKFKQINSFSAPEVVPVHKKSSLYSKATIVDSTLKKDSFYEKGFVLYTIESTLDNHSFSVQRRYNDFFSMDEYLRRTECYHGIILPQLPAKSSMTSYLTGLFHSNREESAQRAQALQLYLDDLIAVHDLQDDPYLHLFLSEQDYPYFSSQSSLLLNRQRTQKKAAKGFKDVSEFFLYTRMYFKTQYQQMTSQQQFMDMKPLETKIEKIKDVKGLLLGMISALDNMAKCSSFSAQQARCPLALQNVYLVQLFEQPQDTPSQTSQAHLLAKLKSLIQKIEASETAYNQLLYSIFQYYLQKNLQETQRNNHWRSKKYNQDYDQQQLESQKHLVGNFRKKIYDCYENLIKQINLFQEKLFLELRAALTLYVQQHRQ